ncbi:Polyketide synthase enoylreductase [Penicillium concentricum]|uniref:Polyketide synthase enoylreductase n=1 Tax=Penicillium concentricum TaxID=293559 RepID=A0A9W9S8W1_9EURO|nr:Polyketide synthase enoylreductase [Penicillium concentricum]KAJ5372769.1 Polyketide synthase enoylreductase [Penicillium concentricum]
MSSNHADQIACDEDSDKISCDQIASDQLTSDQNQNISNQPRSVPGGTIQAPSNQAAWLTAKSAHPLMVGVAPYTPPGPHQIIIKNAAVAVNPVEWTKQLMGDKMFSWINYPVVLGNDCAGEVVQLGDKVSNVKVGDRVLAHALSMDPAVNRSSEGAFQHYTVIRDHMVTEIPDWLSYEEACVVPLGLSTAATALFQSEFLFLNRPGNLLRAAPNSLPEAVLVWGGSTSVGCNAIQLAALAGYEVITTCSPKNFEYVTTLGASAVFDYRNELTIPQIIHLLKDKMVVGAIAIGNDSTEACIKILAKTNGSKFVAQAGFPFPEKVPTTTFQLFRTMAASKWSDIKIFIKSKRRGVKTKSIFGSSAAHTEVGAMIYREFLPEALAGGTFVAAPKPRIVGKGLEQIQSAMDCHMRGVSAQKVVVSL